MTALVFDCDGVLADTERYGHLPAFNQTFREFGLPVEWSVEEYGRRLKIGGGKERMASLLTPEFVAAAGLPTDPEEQAAEIAKWHKRKTAIYTEMVAAGKLPPRPGIRRVISAAQDAGWKLGVASTSAEASVHAILEYAVGPERAGRFDRRSSPATSSPTRSRHRTSTCSPSRSSASLPPRCSSSRTRATASKPRTRRPAVSRDRQWLHGEGGLQRGDPRRLLTRGPGWRADDRHREPLGRTAGRRT